MKIGKKLKSLRKERKMTLRELSEKSGVQIATLSRMENDVMTGTLQSHITICRALGVALSDFYRDLEYDEKTVHLVKGREKEKPLLVRPGKTTTEILTTKITDKRMIPLIIRLQKGGQTQKEESRVGSEKFIYILEGNALLKVGKDEYSLTKGDSIYFDASLPHVLQNTGSKEARILSVSSPASA